MTIAAFATTRQLNKGFEKKRSIDRRDSCTSYCLPWSADDGCFRRGDLLAEEQAGLLGQCTTSEPTGKAGLTSLKVVRGALAPPALKTCPSQCTSGYGQGWDGMRWDMGWYT